MELELVYDSQESIPKEHAGLYTERDGKWHLSGIKGMKTQADVDNVHTGLVKERTEHKTTKAKLAPWTSIKKADGTTFENPADLQAIIDKLPELEAAAAAGGGKSAEAVQKQVEAAKATLQGTMGREITTLKENNAKLAAQVELFEDNMRISAIRNAAVAAATESKIGKINPEAIEDMLLYAERHLMVDEERDEEGNLVIKGVHTRDGVGVTPALGVEAWLSEMQPKKGHWYMPTEGTGPTGSRTNPNNGNNPWSAANWNTTKQGDFFKAHGKERAEQMARAAGTTLGGPRPAGNNKTTVVVQPRRSQGGLRGGR